MKQSKKNFFKQFELYKIQRREIKTTKSGNYFKENLKVLQTGRQLYQFSLKKFFYFVWHQCQKQQISLDEVCDF